MRALLVLLLLIDIAHADSPKLADARKAIDEVRYDDARRLLVEALDAGGNSPGAVRQIYELSASTAIVLNQRELGEQYYRRWLAIEPTAKLPDGSSPKLVEAFVAAQAHMAAHGRLAVRVTRRSPSELEVIVETDPLAMALSVAIAGTPVPLPTDRRVRLPAPAEATRVFVLDERGNQLLAIDVLAAANAPVDPQPDPPPPRPPNNDVPLDEPSRPFMKRWTTWAVPAAGFLIAGAIFGTLAVVEQDKLDESIAFSGQHFFDDVDGKRDKVRRYATLGIGLGAAGLVLAIPTVVFYSRSRGPLNIGALTIAPHPNGVTIVGRF